MHWSVGFAIPRVCLGIAGLVLLASCHPRPQLAIPPHARSVELSLTCEGPNYVLLGVGDHIQLTPALLLGTRPRQITCEPQAPEAVTWSVADRTLARVDRRGGVVGLAPGHTRVTALSPGGLRAEREVHVLPPVERIAWVPARVQIAVGDTVRLEAAAYDAAGHLLERLPPLAFTDEAEQGAEIVEWTVESGTLVRGVRPGYLRLAARLAHRVDTATVHVVAASVP